MAVGLAREWTPSLRLRCMFRFIAPVVLLTPSLLSHIQHPTVAVAAWTPAVPTTPRCRRRPKALRSRVPSQDATDDCEVAHRRYSALIKWMNGTDPSAFVHPSFTIRRSPLGGYGGFASDDIPAGEVILRIPEVACITISDAISDDECGEFIGDWLKTEAGSPGKYVGGTTVALAAYMAKEWLLFQMRQTQRVGNSNRANLVSLEEESEATPSRFAPYLDTLPWYKGYIPGQEHGLFWGKGEDRGHLCTVGAASEEIALMRSEVLHAVRFLQPIVAAAIQKGCVQPIEFAREFHRMARISRFIRRLQSFIFRRSPPETHLLTFSEGQQRDGTDIDKVITGAFVSILSRSFAADMFAERMIPVLDIINHAPHPTIVQRTDDYGCVIVKVVADIKRGEEIFNSYAVMGDGEACEGTQYGRMAAAFFARFGFWPNLGS